MSLGSVFRRGQSVDGLPFSGWRKKGAAMSGDFHCNCPACTCGAPTKWKITVSEPSRVETGPARQGSVRLSTAPTSRTRDAAATGICSGAGHGLWMVHLVDIDVERDADCTLRIRARFYESGGNDWEKAGVLDCRSGIHTLTGDCSEIRLRRISRSGLTLG